MLLKIVFVVKDKQLTDSFQEFKANSILIILDTKDNFASL